MTHSFLAPSAAHVWVHCALYPTLAVVYPDQSDKDASEKGTAAHWVGVELHEGRPVAIGDKAPNGREIDADILETGEFFASSLRDQDNFPWTLEKRIVNDAIIAESNGGTPDAQKFAGHTLDITDWKGGHEWIDVYECWQLINYFALIWHAFKDRHDARQVKVRFRIVQPNAYGRGGPVRTWEISAAELAPYVEKLREAAKRALAKDVTATPGAHCKHCPGRHSCEALHREAMHIGTRARMPGRTDQVPLRVQARELAFAEESAAILDAFITGRRQEIATAIEQGTSVPGYALEHGEGREGWTRSFEEVKAVGDMLGVKVEKPALITPKQARKAGLPESIVTGMSARPRGEAQLVRFHTERMASMFGK